MTTLFVSDLHLDKSRPSATDAFRNFLATEAIGADSLYILGDLFEYWIGDDDPDPHNRSVADALAKLAASGVRCFLMHGNRDFMLGANFIRQSGAILLHDPTLIYVGNESVLLSHGDMLCTDDHSYQRYRRVVRNPQTQRIYNAVPFSWRQRLVLKIRSSSMAKYGKRPPNILDVNQNAVANLLRQYGVNTLLHGHTHRPAIHRFDLDGQPATRIVLGDWYTGSSILRWNDNGPELSRAAF